MLSYDIRLISASYRKEGDGAIVEIFGKTKEGLSVVARKLHRPYFYIIEPDNQVWTELKKEPEFVSLEKCNLWFKGQEREAVKITGKFPWKFGGRSRNCYRGKYESMNATVVACDIPFHLRFIYDYDLPACIRVSGEIETDSKTKSHYSTNIVMNATKFEEIKPFDIPLKIMSFDIENSIKDKTILCICCAIRDGNNPIQYETITGLESEIITKWFECIKKHDPDVLTGYNILLYDIPWIVARAEVQKLVKIQRDTESEDKKPRIVEGMNIGRDGSSPTQLTERTWKLNGRLIIDAWWSAKKELHPKRETLNFLAGELFKESKEDVDSKRIDEEWAADKAKVLSYCRKDAELALRIIEHPHVRVIQKASDLSTVTRLPLSETIDARTSSLVDSFMIREADRRGIAVPHTRGHKKHGEGEEEEDKIEGGYVKLPTAGLYNLVMVLDVKSMYPSQIIKNNICFTTKDPSGPIISPHDSKVRYVTAEKKQGVLPYLLAKWWKERDEAKKKMKIAKAVGNKDEARYYDGLQNAIKVMMNSAYGVLASDFYRFTDKDIGATITAFAREAIKGAAEKLESEGYNVIYSDSVAGDTEIVVKKEDGSIHFVEISTLFKKIELISAGREYSNCPFKTLTIENGRVVFRPIKYVMRHRTNKKMYRVNVTSHWHIDVTEDHSLMGYQNRSLLPDHRCKSINERIIKVRPSDLGKRTKSLVSMRTIPRGVSDICDLGYPSELYTFFGLFIADGSFNRRPPKRNFYLHLSCGSDMGELINKIIEPLIGMGWIQNYWISNTRLGDIIMNGKIVKFMNECFRNGEGVKILPEWMFHESNTHIAQFLSGAFSADGTVFLRKNGPVVRFTNVRNDFIEGVRKLLWKIGISNSTFAETTENRYGGKKSVVPTFSKHVVIKDIIAFRERVDFIIERKKERISNYVYGKRVKRHEEEFDLTHVKNVIDIPTPEFVYDIEVEGTHTFFANGILAHNTDSLFIQSPKSDLLGSVESGIAISERYSEKQVAFEFEKILNPWFTHGAKKRYFGLLVWPPGTAKNPVVQEQKDEFLVWCPMKDTAVEEFKKLGGRWDNKNLYWAFPNNKRSEVDAILKKSYSGEEDDMFVRGYETRRTDSFDMQSNSLKKLFDMVLDRNIDGATEFAVEMVQKVRKHDVPINDLVISRTCQDETAYKNADSMVNVLVARKLKAMGADFTPGMKVSWIVTNSKATPQHAEPYIGGRIFKAEPDWEYYAKRLADSLARVTEAFDWDAEALFSKNKQARLFDTPIKNEPKKKKKPKDDEDTQKQGKLF